MTVLSLWVILVEGPHQYLLTLQTKALCSFSFGLWYFPLTWPQWLFIALLTSSTLPWRWLQRAAVLTLARIRTKQDGRRRRRVKSNPEGPGPERERDLSEPPCRARTSESCTQFSSTEGQQRGAWTIVRIKDRSFPSVRCRSAAPLYVGCSQISI